MNTLKDYVNWKLTHADKVAEAEGYPLVMENCKKNKRMKQLEIFGNSVQDGTPTPDNPIEVQSVGEKSVNLFDVNTYPLTVGKVIYGHNGELGNVSGYAATVTYIPCTDLQGKTITINHTKGANVGVAFYDESKVYISGVRYQNATSITVTVPENAIYYRFSVDVNYIDEIQAQEGDTVTPFEPYGKYKIPVVQRGINYHNYKKFNYKEQTINGITFTPLGDGSFHLKGKLEDTTKMASYRVVIWNAIPVKAGTYHSKRHSNADIIIMFGAYKNSKFWLNINSSSNSGNATLSEDGYIGYCQIYVKANTTREIDDIVYPQLTKGTQDLPYEPYIEPITTNVFLNEPLRKIGDYADYIDFKNDKICRVIKEEIMTGEETFLRMGWDYPYTAYDVGAVGYVVDDVCVCNQLQHQSNFSISIEGINKFRVLNSPSNNVSRVGFRIYSNGAAIVDIDDVKAFLKEKYSNGMPLIFYYGLSNLIEEPITLDLPKLNAKTTIIEADTNLAPSNAKGKYIKK